MDNLVKGFSLCCTYQSCCQNRLKQQHGPERRGDGVKQWFRYEFRTDRSAWHEATGRQSGYPEWLSDPPDHFQSGKSGTKLPPWLSNAAYILIAINVAVYLIEALFFSGRPLLMAGANFGPAIRAGEYYRLVTSMFLHGDMMHLVMNGLAIYILGTMVESSIGPWRFLVLYFAGGLAGSAASLYFIPTIPSVGASGAVFGLFGYLLYTRWRNPMALSPAVSQWLKTLLIVNIVITVLPGTNIDVWGHFGGLAGGFLAGNIVGLPGWRATRTRTRQPREIGRAVLATLILLLGIWFSIFGS